MAERIAVKDDWQTEPMPKKKATFVLKRDFTPAQKEALRRGHIPQEMEDKWFWYMEDGKLYAHRSWTGFCIYTVELRDDGNHRVTVNRDAAQYGCKSLREDEKQLNMLLDWWTRQPYDYYGEWLTETAAALERSEEHKQ